MPKVPTSRKAADAVNANQDKPRSPRTVLELDVVGSSGRRYQGNFPFKVPSIGDRIDIDVRRAHYVQQLRSGLGEDTDQCAHMLAYLGVTIEHDKAPDWWQTGKEGIELYDFEPIATLYAMAVAYEVTFCSNGAEPKGTKAADSERLESRGEGGVERGVQPPAERQTVIADLGGGGRRARAARSELPSDAVRGTAEEPELGDDGC